MEAGSGLGTIADVLLESGSRHLVLCDNDRRYISYLRRKYATHKNILVVNADISSPTALHKLPRVNTIVTINTLEHIQKDSQAIVQLAKILKPGGKLIVFVPAFNFLMGNWDRSIGHFRRYSKSGLEQKLITAGLQIVSSSYFNLPGFFGWWLNKFLGRTPSDSLVKAQISLYDQLIVPWWSRLEELFTLPFGQSVIVVGRK
ncbi:hypothetical protein A2899_01960 [Candidatus Amesbacteria bacterium RIFCSPLOWO2_01_FULL_49_25]|nr:MAG: hypothetical protein A2899_01960 [Candidatus Amesbacteria bacterium RIFCSPLOWO2_01_FULL_49_25]